MNIKATLTIILFFTLSGGMPATHASLVKCPPGRSVKAEFDKAAMVFLGKVVAEEERKLPNHTGPKILDTAQVYRFQVERWWKGGEKEQVEIHVVKMRMPNGTYTFGPEQIHFQMGESYLVYGFANDGLIFASGCTRTRHIKHAQEDLQKLGEGQSPKKSSAN